MARSKNDFKKTRFPGIFEKINSVTKVKTYLARIKVNGVEREKIVGYSNDEFKTNASIAFEKKIALTNELKSGNSIAYKKIPLLDNLMKEYLDESSISEEKLKIYNYFYKTHIPDSLKKRKLKDIKTIDLQNIVKTMIEDGYKPSYIVTLKFMNKIFKKAVENKIIEINILSSVIFPKYDKNRYFELDSEKAKALYQEISKIDNKYYHAMFLLLMRGRRSNEVLTLMWENIDFKNKKYTVTDTFSKIKKTLSFYIDDELLDALNNLEKNKSGLVFISPKTGKKFYSVPRKIWAKLKAVSSIEDMKLHDFRHLMGFTLVNNNVPLEQISRALGHQSIRTTQMYSNQKEKMAAQAVDNYLEILKI